MSQSIFHHLVRKLELLRTGKPRSEKSLEDTVVAFLKPLCDKNQLTIGRQRVFGVDRTDIVVTSRRERIVFEIKRVARTDCFEQLDRYSAVADGLIIVCWRATDDFKRVFKTAQHHIPIALIELKRNAPMIG